jgi:hypothetical protein
VEGIVRQSIASVGRWPVGLAERVTGSAGTPAAPGGARSLLRKLVGLLDDAAFLLLAVWLFPAAILAVGIPLALLIRLLLDMADRM